ncbi:hypothetical protein BD413DRAFT_546796 [Trametes elegans]|nr:hypothetical protein BD413DRAFT_546796 [Trametes elegans]
MDGSPASCGPEPRLTDRYLLACIHCSPPPSRRLSCARSSASLFIDPVPCIYTNAAPEAVGQQPPWPHRASVCRRRGRALTARARVPKWPMRTTSSLRPVPCCGKQRYPRPASTSCVRRTSELPLAPVGHGLALCPVLSPAPLSTLRARECLTSGLFSLQRRADCGTLT